MAGSAGVSRIMGRWGLVAGGEVRWFRRDRRGRNAPCDSTAPADAGLVVPGNPGGLGQAAPQCYAPIMSTNPSQHRVEVEFPAEAFSHHPWEPRELASQLRTLWYLEQVRQRRLGFAKAAELAEIPLAHFLELMGQRQITPFDFDPHEIEQEIG